MGLIPRSFGLVARCEPVSLLMIRDCDFSLSFSRIADSTVLSSVNTDNGPEFLPFVQAVDIFQDVWTSTNFFFFFFTEMKTLFGGHVVGTLTSNLFSTMVLFQILCAYY